MKGLCGMLLQEQKRLEKIVNNVSVSGLYISVKEDGTGNLLGA